MSHMLQMQNERDRHKVTCDMCHKAINRRNNPENEYLYQHGGKSPE